MANIQHRTKTELALQVLREQIRTGELAPGGRMRLQDLTRELDMSPTPIREALRLLQADGLVDYKPHQGIVVAELSSAEMAEISRIRCVLEALATELAVPVLTLADVRELQRVHDKLLSAVAAGRGASVSALNSDWHWKIYERSGSSYLKEFIRRLWERYPWRTMWVIPGRVEASVEEHAEIMDAIRSRDASLAAARMGAHIASGERSLSTTPA